MLAPVKVKKETEFIYTATGLKIDPLNISSLDIRIEDILIGLSHIKRYNGQTALSVLRHSVAVASYFKIGTAAYRRALLHDATEAYFMDVPTALKQFVNGDWRKYYELTERRIYNKFNAWNVTTTADDLITRIDKGIVAYEMDICLGESTFPETLERDSIIGDNQSVHERYLWSLTDTQLILVAKHMLQLEGERYE